MRDIWYLSKHIPEERSVEEVVVVEQMVNDTDEANCLCKGVLDFGEKYLTAGYLFLATDSRTVTPTVASDQEDQEHFRVVDKDNALDLFIARSTWYYRPLIDLVFVEKSTCTTLQANVGLNQDHVQRSSIDEVAVSVQISALSTPIFHQASGMH
ncbi:hypothetical protein BDQ17DRAFT_1338694 [Cyathus striatus]|nr:hypothetical protein BDQ17DRAFT_1338694 [Cyathus striatus]